MYSYLLALPLPVPADVAAVAAVVADEPDTFEPKNDKNKTEQAVYSHAAGKG